MYCDRVERHWISLPENADHLHAFANADGTTSFPVEVTKTAVFFQIRLDSAGPLWFLLDSGAGTNYIDRGVATAEGLTFAGKAQVRGAGSGKVDVDVIPDVSFQLPGLVVRRQRFHATDLGPVQPAWGRRLDGFLGYHFLEHFVVDIDYARRLMAVSDPASYRETARGERLPLEIRERLPYVVGTVKIPGLAAQDSPFLVDSGSQDEVDHPLIGSGSDSSKGILAGQGLGMPIPGRLGRVESLRLGSIELRGLVGVSTETGLGSHLIGGGLLSRFRVVFNYPARTLTLARPD